jgi:hypothetical protein
MVDQFLSDNLTDILYRHASDITWEPNTKLHADNYEKVHYDTMGDVVVLRVISTYTRAIQGKWLSDQIALSKVRDKEVQTPMYAFHAGIPHRLLKGLDPRINLDKPP